VAPLELPPTEEIARSISWGLLQVIGQVAREHGFQRPFSARCAIRPQVLRVAASCWRPSSLPGTRVSRGLARWNGGGNPDYAAQVLARVARYR
jgi:hypothetical protein